MTNTEAMTEAGKLADSNAMLDRNDRMACELAWGTEMGRAIWALARQIRAERGSK